MRETLETLPRLRRPAAVNAAEYWIAPERFARRCGRLGDRFVVPMPATGPWLCLTDPDDIKRVFTADTNVLRFGAALAKTCAAPCSCSARPGSPTVDGPEHVRKRRMQLPAFHRKVLAGYEEVMQRKTEEALAGWCSAARPASHDFMQEIALEVIIAAVFGMTEPARVKRLRTATLALMREASSRRFFLQTIIATSPSGRLGQTVPADSPRDGGSRRGRPRRGQRASAHRRARAGRRARDVPARHRRSRQANARQRALRRDADAAARRATRRPPPRWRGCSSAPCATPTSWPA